MRRSYCITVRRSEWYVVAVLFLIGVFNVMDRQLLSILLNRYIEVCPYGW